MKTALIFISFALLASYALASNVAAEKSDIPQHNQGPKLSVFSAFAQSLSSIIVSELGDKTFFIAAIMSMRYSRIAVLFGALLALLLMTILSTAFGWIVPVLLPPHITHIAITILFFFFGIKLLYDSFAGGHEENDEQAEVEQELNQVHSKLMKNTSKGRKESEIKYITEETEKSPEEVALSVSTDLESSGSQSQPSQKKEGGSTNFSGVISRKLIFWQALTLTFLGEWGDRSQITTIALAAEGNPYAVCIGSFLGHVICTSLAVVGGKFLAKKISEKTVNISGGLLFLIFGVHNLLMREVTA